MSTNTPLPQDLFGQTQINFKMLAAKMISKWYWFLISIILCVLVAYLYLRYTTPIYKTTAKILISNDKNAGSQDDVLIKALGGQFGTASSLEGEAEILKTRHLMEYVVRDLKSYITYFDKGQVRSIDLYKESPFILKIFGSPDSIKGATFDVTFKGTKAFITRGNSKKTVNLYEAFDMRGIGKVQLEKGVGVLGSDHIYTVKVQSIKGSVSSMISKLAVSIPIKGVNILYLDFTNAVPKNSQDVLNKLIESYIQNNIIDKNKIADSTIAFIENRLVYVGKELGEIEGNVQTFKQSNKIADIAQQSAQLITATGTNVDDLAKVETKLSLLNAVEKYVDNSGASERLVPNGALLEDPNLSVLVERYNTIILEKERSSLSQTENNPYMKNLDVQIANAKSDMLSSLRGLKKALTITRDKTQSRSNVIDNQVRNVPAVERKFLDLSRQQQIKQELYLFLLQRREETAISKTSNISNCKVIEPPITFGAISPNSNSVMGYGVILGIFFPLVTIFLADILNKKITSREQISSLTQVPIIGDIGNADTTNESIVVTKGSRTPISEQFRALRTNLDFFLINDQKTILMTSSMSGEGKSFVAINLASVLALSGKKVIIMEMDLRKPNLSNKLNLRNDFGFSNYIVTNEITVDQIIRPSGTNENLFVISSGNIPPNPTEIILNERTDLLMNELKEKFDYIIIDAPPIGIVTDAQLLGKYADLTLYVVRQGYTLKGQMAIPQEIFVNDRLKRLSLLVNDVKNNSSYGAGYGYGYGYYEGATEKKSLISRIGSKFK
jgi:tyrosine-protein kinase Etk/Wzc